MHSACAHENTLRVDPFINTAHAEILRGPS